MKYDPDPYVAKSTVREFRGILQFTYFKTALKSLVPFIVEAEG